MKIISHKFFNTVYAAVISMVLLPGCIVHKVDVQQGNVVTQKQLSALKVGMSKRDVRYVLGTPLVVDPFHSDRWDYYYSLKQGGNKDFEKRRITVVFEQEKLTRIDGDVASLEKDPADEENLEDAGGTKIDKPTQGKKGFFKRTWDRIWD